MQEKDQEIPKFISRLDAQIRIGADLTPEIDAWRDKNKMVTRSLNDPDRDKLNQVIALLEKGMNREEALRILKNLRKRKVMYIGAECARLGKIDIDSEYKMLQQQLDGTGLELNRVKPATVENIYAEWEEQMPSVVFFSCHGDPMGLYLEDETGACKHYGNTDFVSFFDKRLNYTECVVLSSCESLALGHHLKESCKKVICINSKVDIETATAFNRHFFDFLDRKATDPAHVFEKAFEYSLDIVQFKGLQDAFSFEFLKQNLID